MMAMKSFLLLFVINYGACSIIIPEELPSLLSVAYSNIPPVKKGTDSRIGFGFAFGNHADFQVLLELGPQTNTNPIGQAFPTNTKRQAAEPPNKKRNTQTFQQSKGSEYLATWAENMSRPQQPADPPTAEAKPGEVPNLEDSVVELVKNDKGQYEIHQPAPSNMPARVLNQLKKLYGRNPETEDTKLERRQNPKKQDLIDNYPKLSQYNTKQRSKEEIRKVTEDLSNVDLD